MSRPGTWLPGEGIPELLKNKKGPIKGLEIGSDHGWTSDYLLEKVPNLTLYAVDPYSEYIDWNGAPSSTDARNIALDNFNNVVKKYGDDKLILVRKTSDDAASDFEDNTFDFIFIDGIHTYEQVTKDCNNYISKLKKGGLLCGHDYGAVVGVAKAVDEFASKEKKEVNFTQQDVWYWFKD